MFDKLITQNTSYISPNHAKNNCYLSNTNQIVNTTIRVVTVIMLYHNECDLLYFQTYIWKNLNLKLLLFFRFVIIDDNSIIPACNCIYHNDCNNITNNEEEAAFIIDIIRITKPNKWNIAGGRNLGALVTCTEYLFICDLDMYVSAKILSQIIPIVAIERKNVVRNIILLNRILLKNKKFNGELINETRSKPHPGMMIIPRDVYWDIGGCDEDLVGHYGHTDVLFKFKAAQKHYNFHIYQKVVMIPILNRHPKSLALYQNLLPQMDRNQSHNYKIFMKKTEASIDRNLSSIMVIRFGWYSGCKFDDQDIYSMKFNDVLRTINNFKIDIIQYYNTTIFPKRIEEECDILLSYFKEDYILFGTNNHKEIKVNTTKNINNRRKMVAIDVYEDSLNMNILNNFITLIYYMLTLVLILMIIMHSYKAHAK